MKPFERLHPAVQHHIVNSLGWKALRPLQEAAIEPILAGEDALLLAPTAGGKTEAAVLPVFSRMLCEDWRNLSVVYVCPIKALLNNLEERLRWYAGLLGRRVAVWHGDVSQSERARIAREPPDLLLATPESLEVVLVSRRVDHRAFFKGLRVFIIDEVHAFAGDDRGWHLIGLLDRLSRLCGSRPQRLGLSATVGNADALLDWLAAGREVARRVVAPEAPGRTDADVQVDYVGNLGNAATVISRLHRGEKRLVFCDSRAQVEDLATQLRACSVRTFVSHSSLGGDARRQAEAAFAGGDDCVIVATSTLELGIDVGDLDRVIQIDAPATVASFLQRLGRSGRRPGTSRNCLFLATSDAALLRAAALIRLWMSGYVEPIIPPPLPYHVLAQQILALSLQEGGVGKWTWRDWVPGLLYSARITAEDAAALVEYMLAQGIMAEDEGIVALGPEGESRYGLKNFLELFSVFSSPPVLIVLHGRTEIGRVHPISMQVKDRGPITLALGGRYWRVEHVDWNRRQAYVKPVDARGRSRWLGSGQPLGFPLCQSVKTLLAEDAPSPFLSRRATTRLEELREDFSWLAPGETTLVSDRKLTWWTFAGGLANAVYARMLQELGVSASSDDYCLTMRPFDQAPEVIRGLMGETSEGAHASPALDREALEGTIKFLACVPPAQIAGMVARRSTPSMHLAQLASERLREVHVR